PSTVSSVFRAVGLRPEVPIPWGTRVPCRRPGVYVISLSRDADSLREALPEAPISSSAISELLGSCPDVRVDGTPATIASLTDRLESLWLPDEVILYIGRTGRCLQRRLRQYYRTPLGARRPHAGGWPLKALGVLEQLVVHYAPCSRNRPLEGELISAFV